MNILERNILDNSFRFEPSYRKALPVLSLEKRYGRMLTIMDNLHVIPREVVRKIQKIQQHEKQKLYQSLQNNYNAALSCKENFPQNDYLLETCQEIQTISTYNFYGTIIFIFILLNIIICFHATEKP